MVISTEKLLKDKNVVEDLGLVLSEKTRKRVRTIVVRCPSCKTERNVSLDAYKRRSGLCRSCSASKRDRTLGSNLINDARLGNTKNKVSNKHPIYKSWAGMKDRCYNKNSPDYVSYGKKGVTVCDEWKDDFNSFYEWSMNNGWVKGLCLDKDILCDAKGIEPKVYRPDTCQWITRSLNSSYSANQRRRLKMGLKPT